jgi:hypothetical protein
MMYAIFFMVFEMANRKFIRVSEDVFSEFQELREMEGTTNTNLLDAALEALKRDIAKRRHRNGIGAAIVKEQEK